MRAPRRSAAPSSVRPACAMLCALLAGSCSGSGSDHEASGPHHPALRPAQGAEAPREVRTLLRLVPGVEQSLWQVTDLKPRYEEGGQLVIGGARSGNEVGILRRGELDLSEANLLRVHGAFGGSINLRILLQDAEGETLARTRRYRVPHLTASTTLDLDLPRLPAGARVEVLHLDFRGLIEHIKLEAVELVHLPLEGRLPDPAGEADWISIGGDLRSGVGLTARRPLATNLVPSEDAVFSFAYGVPESLPPIPAGSELLVRVLRDGVNMEEHPLAIADVRDTVDEPRTWQRASIPLGGWAGHELEIEIALSAPADHLGLCAVAEPYLHVPPPRGSSKRPTVLLVSTDTHRGDHLGIARDTVGVRTPNLDALAARGVHFDTCFTAINSTNPSHVALMTGRHPRDTGILSNRKRLSEKADTLAEVFRAEGYVTWATVSVAHLMDSASGLGQGFDRLAGPMKGRRSAGDGVSGIEGWMEDLDGRPLFLWAHFFDAHAPYRPPLDDARTHLTGELASALEAEKPVYDSDDPEVLRALYRGEVDYLDRELGRLFNLEPLRDAIVAVVGDHGESLGAHGISFAHLGLYPDSLRVPLIVAARDLGARSGARVDSLVRQMDVARTLVELAGLARPDFPGNNLLRHLEEGAGEEPNFALHANWLSASITHAGYHLIMQFHEEDGERSDRPRELHALELYDLRADPACTIDLVESEQERVRALRSALITWLADQRDLGWLRDRELTAEQEQELQGLGYTDAGGGLRERFEDDCDWCLRFR